MDRDVGRLFRSVPVRMGAAVAAVLIIAGCATKPEPSDADAVEEYELANDPYEPFNRAVFQFNDGLDKFLLRPLAIFYKDIFPPILQDGTHNVLNNVETPVTLLNDMLQGEWDRAETTVVRFAINTTLGVGGLIDVAQEFGYEYHYEDFGQTLAVWGVDEGPYLVLPIIGPSNPRDAGGLLVDVLTHPLTWWAYTSDTGSKVSWSVAVADVVDWRARNYQVIKDLRQQSLDFYAAVRSAYRQRRNDEINQGQSTTPDGGPSLGLSSEFPGYDDVKVTPGAQ